MTQLLVAAGGGGDVIGTTLVHHALHGDEPAVVLSYSWERLTVDPLPGPRSERDFTGLRPLTPGSPGSPRPRRPSRRRAPPCRGSPPNSP